MTGSRGLVGVPGRFAESRAGRKRGALRRATGCALLLLTPLVAGCVLVGPAPWVAEVSGADVQHPATARLDMVRTGDASWAVSGILYRTNEPKAESLHGLAVLRVEGDAVVTHMTVTGGGTSLTCDIGPGPGFFLDGVCFDQDRNGYSVRVRRF